MEKKPPRPKPRKSGSSAWVVNGSLRSLYVASQFVNYHKKEGTHAKREADDKKSATDEADYRKTAPVKLNCNKYISPSLLPTNIANQLTRLRGRLNFSNIREFCQKLNIPYNDFMLSAAPEYKYVFEYLQLYGSLEYNESHHVSDDLILTPLSEQANQRFSTYFNI